MVKTGFVEKKTKAHCNVKLFTFDSNQQRYLEILI